MYISIRNLPTSASGTRTVSGTVVVLGFVSLLTDISTEMVAATLPLFVSAGLGLSPLAFGFVDSVYQAGSAVARLAGGYVADRLGRPKGVAVTGYGIGALSKLLLLPVTTLFGLTVAVGLDRVGKGVRTGPRDRLIAEASREADLGRSFGVHRALDTTGALLGPAVAFYLLLASPLDFTLVFGISAGVAWLGVILLVSRVAESPQGAVATSSRLHLRQALGILRRPSPFRKLSVTAFVLSTATISDAFVYLVLLDGGAVSVRLFPLLFIGTSLAYLVTAVPVGRLADRVGRRRVFIVGHLLVALAYFVAARADTLSGALITLVLLGLYYSATDGVLAAAAVPLADLSWRATAIATLQTCVAGGRSLAALAFGALWVSTSARTALWTFMSVVCLVLVAVAPVLLREKESN